MKRIKKYKQDILLIIVFSILYLGIVLLLTHGKYVFAAKTDFAMQHYIFPEYFRNLFYKTKDLFPDFALNLGGGQNIYNFSYYGLLNPIILISYLFPMIPMFYYLIGASFIIVVSSTYLFYRFLKSHNFKTSTSIIVSLLFLFASPIIYHAKRHIMFINYFPFLLLALFGVDRVINKKNSSLLVISIALMIFTSFYYSVAGIVVILIYAFYRYLQKGEKQEIIEFIKKFFPPILIAVLISAILWLPTAYTLLMGRGESIKKIEIWMLLIPNLKVLYRSYGPGITLLEFIILGVIAIDKDSNKKIRYLALTILIILIFPIFNYILNGTLYVNSKSLIPFLPLILYVIAVSLETVLKHYKKLKIYLVLSTCIITIIASFTDPLIPISEVKSKDTKNYKDLVDEITKKDPTFYRIGNETKTSSALNKVFTLKEYKSSVYSSTENRNYQEWLHKKQKNNQIYRNNMMLSLSGNILSEALMSEKYTITTDKRKEGYKLINKKGNLYLYKNELALPIIYTTKNDITEDEYNQLEYPENVIATYTKKVPDKNLFTKVKFNLQSTKNLTVTKTENALKIRANNNASMTLLPSEDLKDKILFITFKNKFNRGCHGGKDDQTITINNITNKLTCRDWKYHNQNYVFHYVLTSPEKLVITFSKAYYKLGNIKVLAFPKEELEKEKESMIPASIEKINQDKIKAKVTVDEKRTVNIAIPYDKGFKITVDGKKIAYKESIQNTIIFKMDKGTHQIAISYEAPWKKLGIIISMIGILIFIYQIRKERSCNK